MANAKNASTATLVQRRQVAQAVLEGFLDSAVAADLTTAKNNGYVPNNEVETAVDSTPIAGVNR